MQTLMRQGRRGRLSLLLALWAVLITGCGTTVAGAPGAQGGAVPTAGDGLAPAGASTGAPTGTDIGAPTASGARAAGSATPPAVGNGTGAGAAAGARVQAGASGAAPGQPPSGAVSGWGFDRKRIFIGVGTAEDAGAYASSVGLNVNVGDPKAQAQALINDINRRGGLLGRQIVPVWHDVSTANYNADPSGEAEAMCADWTQDNHVFAGVNTLTYPENGVACLAKAGTIALASAAGLPMTTTMLQRYSPYLYAPGVAETGRLTPALVDALVRQRYFTGWDTTSGKAGSAPVKIGVLYSADRPDLLALFKQALAKYRLRVDDSFLIKSSSDAGQLSAVVLRFKSEGITHVLTNGALTFFPTAAESQGFRPRYGVSSWDVPQLAASQAGAQQLAGALGLGWVPSQDVAEADDPGQSAAAKQCLALMRAAGQDTANRTTQAVMEVLCEQFWLLRASLSRAAGLGPAAMRDGVEALDRSFPSPLTFGERFAANRHAGVAAARPLRFESGCSCFTYGGPATTFA